MKTFFQHVLVPVDFTEKNLAAIEVARELARANDSKLTLLHVIEHIDFPIDDELSGFYEKMRRHSESEMDKLIARFDGDALDVGVETIVNHRSKGIALYAAENDVDLIVMSSHAFNPKQASESLGTISYQVSALCRCSVMLIKQAASRE